MRLLVKYTMVENMTTLEKRVSTMVFWVTRRII